MQYSKINLMIPTFKRVDRLQNLILSACETASFPDGLRFSICVNVNDNETKRFLTQDLVDSHIWCPKLSNCGTDYILEHTKQPNLSYYWNLIFDTTKFHDENTLVSMIGDDMEFVTPGWDKAVLDAVNARDGAAVVYCDDDFIQHEKCCVNLFTTRKIVEATKKPFMCPKFHADMIDTIWTYAGAMSSTLQYLSDVKIRHNHNTMLAENLRDENHKRLKPVQDLYHNNENYRYALAYASIMAANIVDAGLGKWNSL